MKKKLQFISNFFFNTVIVNLIVAVSKGVIGDYISKYD